MCRKESASIASQKNNEHTENHEKESAYKVTQNRSVKLILSFSSILTRQHLLPKLLLKDFTESTRTLPIFLF